MLSSEAGKVSVCRESKDNGEPSKTVQLTHAPIYLAVRVHLRDGFLLLLTLGRDGEAGALRCWRELTLGKFEPSWSAIFKTTKLQHSRLAEFSSRWSNPVANCTGLLPNVSLCSHRFYATSLALLRYILNMCWNQLTRREASRPSDRTHSGSAVTSTRLVVASLFKHLFPR